MWLKSCVCQVITSGCGYGPEAPLEKLEPMCNCDVVTRLTLSAGIAGCGSEEVLEAAMAMLSSLLLSQSVE